MSPDDFSGSEAEDRLKSRLQNNMESPPVAEDGNEPGAIVDNNPPDPSDAPQAANPGRSKSSSFRMTSAQAGGAEEGTILLNAVRDSHRNNHDRAQLLKRPSGDG